MHLEIFSRYLIFEIFQANFCNSSLCLKTDLETVVDRKERMRRQREIVRASNKDEIQFFLHLVDVS